jgi:hypothetical protein
VNLATTANSMHSNCFRNLFSIFDYPGRCYTALGASHELVLSSDSHRL